MHLMKPPRMRAYNGLRLSLRRSLSLLRANSPKGGDAELRDYRDACRQVSRAASDPTNPGRHPRPLPLAGRNLTTPFAKRAGMQARAGAERWST